MKLISAQQIADALGLSRVTVWKVLNGKPGVSAATLQKVHDYIENNQREELSESHLLNQPKRITLLASRIETSIFWTKIVDEIIGELSLKNILVDYIPVDVLYRRMDTLYNRIIQGQSNGIIILNIYDPDTISFLSHLPFPKVFLDTTPDLSACDLKGDLVLLEGEKTVQQITENFIQKNFRKIGFIGDIFYARTNLMRWNGFQNTIKKHGLTPCPQFYLTGPIGKDCYHDTIKKFLEELQELPQAFVCASDFVAFNVLSILRENPEHFSQYPLLSGYDDSHEFLLAHQHITTVHVKNDLIGARLVNQLLFRIENPSADFEEITIFSKILFRN